MFLAICLTRLGRSDTLPQQYTLSMEIPVVAQPETVPIVNAVPITDTPQPVIPIYGIYAYPASVATVVPLAIGETQPGTISDTSQSIQWNPMAATTTTNLLGTGQSNPIAPTAKSANENPIIQSQPVESNTNIVPVA